MFAHVEKFIPAFFVSVPSNRVEKVRDLDVSPHDGVHGPFGAKKRYTRMRLSEYICAFDEDLALLGSEPLSGENLEKGRLSSCDGPILILIGLMILRREKTSSGSIIRRI